MSGRMIRWVGVVGGGLLGVWLVVRYALPVLLPFLLGTGLAVAAEPLVGLLHRKMKLRRWMAAGIGVTVAVILLIGALVLMIALLVRQVGRLGTVLPQVLDGVYQGMDSMEQWLLSLSDSAPGSLQGAYTNAVTGFFSGSSSFVDRIAGELFGFATGLLKALTSGVFGFATAVLSSFMISVRLPRLRQWLSGRIPKLWRERYLPMLKGMRRAVTGWLSAQAKLSGVALAVLLPGFWALGIQNGILWAVVVAVVDVLPVLGCGTVLVPWSLICLLQGQRLRGLGLLGIYALIWLLRSVLEPRLLGKELGLDPLVTLLAVYVGYQLLGLTGMLLAPILAVVLSELPRQLEKREESPREKG